MTQDHKDLAARLARVEGQVAALRRRVETEEAPDCAQTLIQVKAASQGLKRFAEAFTRTHAKRCVAEPAGRARVARELDGIISSAFSLS